MSALAHFLEPQLERLIERWTARIAEGLAPEVLSEPVLRDHIQEVLRELVLTLRHGSVPDTIVYARKHGQQRYQVGFDLDAMVREYGTLRSLILELSEEAQLGLTMAEIRLLTDFLAEAVAEAVTEYDQHRVRSEQGLDRQLRASEDSVRTLLTQEQEARQKSEALAETLAQREDLLRLTLDSAAVATWDVDLGTRTLTGDARFFELFGLPAGGSVPLEQALGRLHPEDLDRVVAPGQAAVDDREGLYRAEFRARSLVEGEYRWLEARGRLRRGPDGAPLRVLGTLVEVTDAVRARQQAQESADRLRISEQRLRDTLAIAGAGTWQMDPASLRFTLDERVASFFGLPSGESLTLTTVLSRVHPDDRRSTGRAVAAALAGKDGGRFGVEHRTHELSPGRFRWVIIRGQAHFDAAGQARLFVGSATDITARKEAELTRVQILASLTEQEVFGVAVLRGTELRYEMANQCYRAMVGKKNILDKTFAEALPELAGTGVVEVLRNVLRTGKSCTALRSPLALDLDGSGQLEERFFDVTRQPIVGPDGTVDSLLVLTHDVTEVVRTSRREEERAHEENARAVFAQQLIGIVSHDLRTPLGAIRVGAELLLPGPNLGVQERKVVERIRTSTERAESLVRALLDFTQVRLGGGLPLDGRPTDLHALTRAAVEEVEAANPRARFTLQTSGDGRGVWDADRLAQVVQNLVTNAVKYGVPDEVITVTTRTEEGWATIRVHNRGDAIPADLQEAIFQPMARGAVVVESRGLSVGLGLFIVRAIAEGHGGRVEVRSSPTEGTTFLVSLPRQASGDGAARP